MALEMRPNDNAREGRPSVWIFSGQSVVLLVVGVGLSLVLFRVANALWGFETVPSLVIGIMPLALITAFVAFFVNGKPESYALDLALLQIFRIQRWLYLTGIVDRPPEFWVRRKPPRHPREFTANPQD
ncbi:MAG TPA: hypothetical protein VE641_13105 [Chthoniobacterales bacterium]|nr:hypothetical protein [Chthoniobacterales bacterium]